MMQLKAASAAAVRGKPWSGLLVSQAAEGWAGTEDVCAPGKPKGADGSARRPHETAEGKELHLVLPRKTQSEVREERENIKPQNSAELVCFYHKTVVVFPSLFIFCLGLLIQGFQIMSFL